MPNYRNAGPGSRRIYEVTLQLTAEQIACIRAELDRIPFRWAPTAVAMIAPALPFIESAASPSADSAPSAPTPQETEGRFFVRALTPKGLRMAPELARLLSRLPHGDSL